MPDDRPKPPLEWLDRLHEAGQWERLIELARQSLAVEPDDAAVHYHLAWAFIRTERKAELKASVDFLLNVDPGDVRYRQIAAIHAFQMSNYPVAWEHLNECLRDDPQNAAFHHLAALIAAREGRVDLAKAYIGRARAAAPEDANIAHFYITLNAIGEEDATGAWLRIGEYEKALAHDPEHDGMLASIGDVYLEQLEQPKMAEDYYRRALSINPHDKDHQQRLWRSIKARNMFFRTLCVPFSAWSMTVLICRGLAVKPSVGIWFLLGFKFVICFFLWLLAMTFLFGPVALCFEWLVLADIQRASRLRGRLGSWAIAFHRLPFTVRFLFFTSLALGLWAWLFYTLNISVYAGLCFIGGVSLLHFIILTVHVRNKKRKSAYARLMAAERKTPPPLPPMSEWRTTPPPLPAQPPPIPKPKPLRKYRS